jgi:aconitase A
MIELRKSRGILLLNGREEEYRKLEPGCVAYYDGLIRVDLSRIEPMIALPFHPSNAFTIRELKAVKPWAAAFAPGTPVEEFLRTTGLGSLVFMRKPGDGSAREQAASCQKVF